jgi:pimeloyl-ACP methyl ester carboxylesterase
MRRATWKWAGVALVVVCASAGGAATRSVEVPIGKAGEIEVAEIIARLAAASGVAFPRPATSLTLSTRGMARSLTKTLLAESLGPEVSITFRPGAMVMSFDENALASEHRELWLRRLRDLSDRASDASRHRQSYGMRALKSYRPNDPKRPTICLVHGLNSSSGGFVHMIPLLEEAGYGIVIYDFPFNRRLEESCAAFARDWAAFRTEASDRLPWEIVAHSMGALLARSLVEDDASWARDVRAMILIAPVNHGSHLAKVQTLIQLANGLKAIRGKNTTKAMLSLADGLGQAADDLLPGSAFLKKLNERPRRPQVRYHILAGDRGFLTQDQKEQLEGRLELVTRNTGIFGRLTQAATADVPDLLEELTDATGDGCVAVERTRLAGVADHVTIHANHAELIRAPLLFPDPGPVACMPEVLRWLKQEREGNGATRNPDASEARQVAPR